MNDIKLNFKINDSFLASYVITRFKRKDFVKDVSDEYHVDIVKFQDKAWEKSQKLSQIVNGVENLYASIPLLAKSNFQEVGADINAFIQELIKTDEYTVLRKQTEESILECQNEWNKNYRQAAKYIRDLGIKIEGEFTIWMTHPGLLSGSYLGNNNTQWGYRNYWPNYNTVYLWHEILHSYFDLNTYEHTLIELITDDHMRSLLNGDSYPPFEGHEYLTEFKKEAFPIWKKYLKSDNKNLKNLVAQFKSAYEVFNNQ